MRIKNIVVLSLILTLTLSFAISAMAYYRDTYWECTSEGEASLGDFYGRRAGDICTSTCCILCVNQYPSIYCYGSEAEPICQCGGGNPNDFEPPTITIVSPVEGQTYNVKNILIRIQTDESATIKRKIDDAGLYTACSGCTSTQYTQTNMKEGEHTLYVEARDEVGNRANKTIMFKVDTLAPVIDETKPIDGAYVNDSWNEFSVKYDETNVVSVVLKYKSESEGSYHEVNLDGCESGSDKNCETLVNLDGYAQGTVLQYYFSISDAASATNSATAEITVDNGNAELPFIIRNPADDQIYGVKKIPFDLSSADIADFYYSVDGIRFSRLCSDCKSYTKNVTSIKDGIYNIIIRKIDALGNSHDIIVNNIMKDTKNPKIKKILPDDGSNVHIGDFMVIYDEYYTKEIILHYGPTGNENAVARGDCASGKKVNCTFYGIDLSSYDGQQIKYYFNISDYVRTVGSKVYTLNVDTTEPILTVNSPVENGLYDNAITFGITSSEMVTIELSDNGGTYSRLCGNCNAYSQRKSFSLSNHNLKIRATDPAGNVDEKTVNVIIY